MIRTWCTGLWFVLRFVSLSLAQTNLTFEFLSTQHGLSQSTVRSICQDQEGFMWFGTHNGLNKFDGYSFTVFKPNPRDPDHSFHHNIITYIHEDRQGGLWVTTLGGGLHHVDKQTGDVKAFEIGINRNTSWNTLFSIHEDKQGFLWIASGNGLAQFDPRSKRFKLYSAQKYFVTLAEGPSGRFWVGGIQGVHEFDPATGHFTPVPVKTSQGNQPFISSLRLDKQGILWAGGLNGGLWQMDTKSRRPRFSAYNLPGLTRRSIRYNGILAQPNGHLWLATGDGLQYIDPKANQVITYQANMLLPNSLSNNSIQSLYQDRAGTLWVGTNNGINKTPAYTKAFKTDQIIPTTPSIRHNSNYINTLLEDHSGVIWLGSTAGAMEGGFQNGLFRLDPKRGQMKPVPVNAADANDPANKSILAVYEDGKRRLWVGTQTGLYRLNRQTDTFTRCPYPFSVRCIAEDQTGNLWLASTSAGDSAVLSTFNPTLGQFTAYRYRESDTSGLNNPFLYHVLTSRGGDIYIATGGGGLNRLNPKTGKFTHYMPNYQSPDGHINDKEVRCLYEDKQGIIWIGTGLGGLNRFDPRTRQFIAFTTQEGLPSNRTLSITGDARGNLWLGTVSGLNRFNPTTHLVRNYDVTDGLPDNEFNTVAVQNHRGKLLFGTRNGLVSFYPDSIKDNRIPPPVYITSVQVLEKRRNVPKGQLELAHEENFISFEFVALNFNAPEKNQYAFQLEGLDKQWVYSGHRRFTSYSDLAPGLYTFRVKASNNDGVWSNTGAVVRIVIHPPWWQTIWFRIVAVLVLLLLTGMAIRLYTHMKLGRQRNEMKRVLQTQDSERERIAADLHDDLGGVIATINQKLSQSLQTQSLEELRQKVQQIQQITSQAGHKVRSIAHNLMPPEFERIGLVGSVQQLVSSLNDARFQFSTFGQPRRLAPDVELNVYRILSELVHNIQKHAQAKQVMVQLLSHPDTLSLIVEDDGIGNRVTKNGGVPTGIGLKNISSRVNYLGARWQTDATDAGTTTIIEIRYDSVPESHSNRRRPPDV